MGTSRIIVVVLGIEAELVVERKAYQHKEQKWVLVLIVVVSKSVESLLVLFAQLVQINDVVDVLNYLGGSVLLEVLKYLYHKVIDVISYISTCYCIDSDIQPSTKEVIKGLYPSGE